MKINKYFIELTNQINDIINNIFEIKTLRKAQLITKRANILHNQNKISCIYVIKSKCFIIFLCILKKSNKIPIIVPVMTKISNNIKIKKILIFFHIRHII